MVSVEAALVLELGGGGNPKYRPNVDITEQSNVDIVHDLREGIPFDNESAGGIYSRDFLEHLSFSEALKLLAECNRVLVDGGYIEFIVPDAAMASFFHQVWNSHLENVFMGTRKNANEHHKMWYSPELLRYILDKEGWHDVIIENYRQDENWHLEPKFKVRAVK